MAPPAEVDVIIVGGGAAGCVVAGRLAKADPTLQIAIIEAGQDNKDFPTSIQPAMYLSHLAPTSTTVSFYASKENAAAGGRPHIVPTGGMLGGGSSVNFLMYTRGSASDYDDWNQEGWSFNDLLPLTRKTETNHLPNQRPKMHGNDGPLNVSYGGHQSSLSKEFLQASKDCYDVPYNDDIQDFRTGHGITQWGKWIHPETGRRQDTAHGFVHPIVATQSNLHVLTEQKTIRVVFDADKRATGVEYCANPLAKVAMNPEQPPTVGTVHTMKARKLVVLSSGAFGTPQILERSGVGEKDILEKAGIEVVVDLPGVGKEYQDHQLTLATYKVDDDEDTLDDYLRGDPAVHAKVGPEWAKTGKGLVATNGIDACFKARPTEAEVATMGPAFQKVWKDYFVNKTDKPVMFGGIISAFLGDHSLLPPGKYCMMGGYLEYPMSRGSLHISSKDPFSAPDFDAGFLTDEADLAPQVWMYKVLREIARRMPTSRGEVAAVHPKFSATSDVRCADKTATDSITDLKDYVYSAEDDAAVEDWIRENVGTTWHSMATCPMKERDAGGVVDNQLNVYGTSGLKLADLSICPANVGSNTYSVALTVGEKAAMLIGEQLGIAV